MKVLVVGGGGREHALAWKIAESPRVAEVIVAPGNAGTALEPKCRNAAVTAADIAGLVSLARDEHAALTVIGPEAPLVAGIVDAFEDAGLACFGPRQAAARLEGSKQFTKEFLVRHRIPTASYAAYTRESFDPAAIRAQRPPIVVKADGLAAGKGVVIASSAGEAIRAAEAMFGGAFGDAGRVVVVEEFLEGEEASFIVMAAGEQVLPLATSQDHKRLRDGDEGPNTGGMGAYSPAPVMTEAMCARVMEEMVYPTLRAMKAMGSPYKGVLFAGVMVTKDGPKLVEYNARFGDPECQVLMLRMMSDIVPALIACADGQLKNFSLRWFDEAALTVIIATKGYPGDYAKGSVIEGLDEAAKVEGVEIFHAGTVAKDGQILANGGRVLNICATGKSVTEAQARAYRAVDLIRWPEGFCRRDIGRRAVAREQAGS
jgi:phosphoribosylamine--glycine ligase